MIRRRDFILWIGGAALLLPLGARAQQPRKRPVIGFLSPVNAEPALGYIKEGLQKAGYVEGRNIQFEVRAAGGKAELLPRYAAELVRLKVDLIIAIVTPAVHAAKQATREIPIVMLAGDPVGTGLIASLARPGGNITGFSATTAELGGKLLQLIREILPSAKRVAVLANATDPFTKFFVDQIEGGGRALSIDTPVFRIRGADEYEAAFAEIVRANADALIVQPSLPRKLAIDFASRHRLAGVSPTGLFPDDGGLVSYSANFAELYRDTALYVDQILKGAKPADLPVQQPTKFELVVNLKTAKSLGITIPGSVLVRADRVIE